MLRLLIREGQAAAAYEILQDVMPLAIHPRLRPNASLHLHALRVCEMMEQGHWDAAYTEARATLRPDLYQAASANAASAPQTPFVLAIASLLASPSPKELPEYQLVTSGELRKDTADAVNRAVIGRCYGYQTASHESVTLHHTTPHHTLPPHAAQHS